MITTFVGVVASICTTIAFLPQVIKSYKTKLTRDVSLGTTFLLFFGVACWTIYGFLRDDIILILANVITFVFVTSLLILKIKYK